MALYSAIVFTNSWLKDSSQAAVLNSGFGDCHQLVKIEAAFPLGDIDPVSVLHGG